MDTTNIGVAVCKYGMSNLQFRHCDALIENGQKEDDILLKSQENITQAVAIF